MNFGYRKTVDKQIALTSLKHKLSTKLLVNVYKFGLLAIIVCVALAGFFGIGMVRGIIRNAPSVKDANIMPQGYRSKIYDSNNKQIESLVTSGSNRELVALNKIPLYTQHAFICIEDERFYEHNGIDPRGILRAAYTAVSTSSLTQGASTITQQVLKNNVFTNWTSENSFGEKIKRKLQEQYLAVKLEEVKSKDDILYSYLNTINLGSNTLGIEQASNRYFGKSVSKLTISESAVLAGITQNPSKYNPITHPEYNAERRAVILQKMLDQGYISKKEYTTALKDKVYDRIKKVDAKVSQGSPYSYFVDALIDQLATDLQEKKGYTPTQAYNLLYGGGLKIYSTQDTDIQQICDLELNNDANYPSYIQYSVNWAYTVQHADGTVENYSENSISYYHRAVLGENNFKLIFQTTDDANKCVQEYKKAIKQKGDKVLGEKINYTKQPQISFTMMDQSTGYVKAIVGGRGEKTGSLTLNRATDATRQPGSTIKPIGVYGPAIDTKGYSIDTKVKDEPYTFSNGTSIHNWNDSYAGDVSIKYAIEQSINVVAVKVLTDITPEVSFDYLQKFGISTLVTSQKLADGSYATDLGQAQLALGGLTHGVKNIEMCAAYATIANGGVYHKPVLYTKVYNHDGSLLLDNTKLETTTVIKPSTAYSLTQALKGVVDEGTGNAAKLYDMPVAGKTGTTSNNYDLWFVGFTPYLTGAIWTGFDENTIMDNASWHTALWQKIMSQVVVLKGQATVDFALPEGMTTATICDDSGMLANGYCPKTHTGYYSAGEEAPTDYCNWHTEPQTTKSKATDKNDSDASGDSDTEGETTEPSGETTTPAESTGSEGDVAGDGEASAGE